MIRIATEQELYSYFRPIDRDHVFLSQNLKFPLVFKNYMSWEEPSGHRVYLVFENATTGRPLGVAFRKASAPADSAPVMCEWCHAVRGRGEVRLMTAAASRDRRIGLYLCADLHCEEEITNPPGVNDLRESLSQTERIQRLMERMRVFAKGNLF